MRYFLITGFKEPGSRDLTFLAIKTDKSIPTHHQIMDFARCFWIRIDSVRSIDEVSEQDFLCATNDYGYIGER